MNRALALALVAMLTATIAMPAQAWIFVNGVTRNGSDSNGISRNGVDVWGVAVLAIELPPQSE